MGEPEKGKRILWEIIYHDWASLGVFLSKQTQDTEKEWWCDWMLGLNLWRRSLTFVIYRQTKEKI